MKLIFNKDENQQISVFQELDSKQCEFSYVDMIKALMKSKKMADPIISEGFSKDEIKSIKSMISHINKAISKTD